MHVSGTTKFKLRHCPYTSAICTNLSITFTPLQSYLYMLLHFNEQQAMARINIEFRLCTAKLHTHKPHLNRLMCVTQLMKTVTLGPASVI